METSRATDTTARFPFRPINEADAVRVRGEMGKALIDLDGLLSEVIFRTLGRGLSRHDKEDTHQDLIAHLLANVFPSFDSTRGTQLSTYVYTCSHAYLLTLARKQERRPAHVSIDDAPEPVAPDATNDRRIEAVANAIVTDPSRLTGRRRGAVRVTRRPQLNRLGKAVRKRVLDIAADELT